MLETISKSIVEKMISKRIINDENTDIYLFGLHQMFLLTVNTISILSISIFFNRLLFGVLFLLFFIPLRSFAGGLHASTSTKCYLYSVIYYTIMMLLMKKLSFSTNTTLLFMCIVIIITFFLVPVEDNNHKLDNVEYYFYQNRSRIVLIVEGIIFIISFLSKAIIIYQSCYYSIISVFFLVICGLIKNRIKA